MGWADATRVRRVVPSGELTIPVSTRRSWILARGLLLFFLRLKRNSKFSTLTSRKCLFRALANIYFFLCFVVKICRLVLVYGGLVDLIASKIMCVRPLWGLLHNNFPSWLPNSLTISSFSSVTGGSWHSFNLVKLGEQGRSHANSYQSFNILVVSFRKLIISETLLFS